jgi:hypothetical protein
MAAGAPLSSATRDARADLYARRRIRNEEDMESVVRFSVVQIKDGPWIVVDGSDHRRRIASCVDAGAARMIAALMNGDVAQAIVERDAAIADLSRSA